MLFSLSKVYLALKASSLRSPGTARLILVYSSRRLVSEEPCTIVKSVDYIKINYNFVQYIECNIYLTEALEAKTG